MFCESGLTSLLEGLLPATTLAKGCYEIMFNQCSNLNIETSGDSDYLIFTCPTGGSTNCYTMFNNVKGGTVAVTDGASYYWADSE